MMRSVPWAMLGVGGPREFGGPIGGTSSHAAHAGPNGAFATADKISNGSREFTYESWLLFDDVAPATMDVNPTIELAQGGLKQNFGVGHASYHDVVNIDIRVDVYQYNPDWSTAASAGVAFTGFAPVNTWVHLAVTGTRNGPGDHTIRVYRNGIEVGAFAFAGDHTPFEDARLFLRSAGGSKPIPNETESWGLVVFDEVRVWNRALSEAEILAGMSQLMDPVTSNLISCHRLDNSLANTVPGGSALNADAPVYITPTPF